MAESAIEWTEQTLFGEPLPRRCSACRETKAIAAFKVDRSRPDGHGYICRECENPPKPGVPTRSERTTARAKGLAWCKACGDWRPLAGVAKWGLCRAHQNEADRTRYAADEEHRRARRAHSLRRKRGIEPVPPEGRESLTAEFEGYCAYCEAPATTWDHVIPVVRGGLTLPDNILPACTACNSSKRDRDLEEWLQATGRCIRPQALIRLAHYQVL